MEIREKFNALLTNLNSYEPQDIEFLKSVIQKFPYFQPAYTLLALKNHLAENKEANDSLKKAALHIGDREVLYQLIKDSEKELEKNEVTKQKEKEPLNLNDTKAETDLTIHEDKEIETDKKLTFSEWLNQYKIKNTEIPRDIVENNQESTEKIIADFIKKKPSMPKRRESFYNPTEMAKKSVEEDENLVTETLARINANQGNTNKAIAMYEKLALLYPEKSDYFADRIKELKK